MKRILFLSLFFSFVFVASAQINLGIKAGYNSSLCLENITTRSESPYTLENLKGEIWENFHVGAFVRFGLKRLYIQPELLYSVQQKKFDIAGLALNGEALDINSYLTINSVEVPLYLGFKLIDTKAFNLRLFTGPKFLLNTNSQLNFTNASDGQRIDISELEHEFQKAAIDVELGLGIDVFMFSLDAKIQGILDKYEAFQQSDWVGVGLPSSNFVISLAWKIF